MWKAIGRSISIVGFLFVSAEMLQAQPRNLDIYWIDTEGGGATLVVSPGGESLLVDTGWEVGDRDAKRIVAAVQQAGLKRIDYLVITHFHADHVGGLGALAKMIPIEKCLDHGNAIEPENQRWLDAYMSVCANRRTIVSAGDRIPLKGVQVDVIASDGKLLAKTDQWRWAESAVRDRRTQAAGHARESTQRGRAFHIQQIQVPRSGRPQLGDGNGVVLPGQPSRRGLDLPDEPARCVRRRRRAGTSLCRETAGRRREQRTAERSRRHDAACRRSLQRITNASPRRRAPEGVCVASVAAGQGTTPR